jgi:archaemetzincin
MKAVHLLGVGAGVSLELLDELAAGLARVLRVSCHVRSQPLDAGFAFDPARNQYYSTAILQQLIPLAGEDDIRLLGVAAVDLFVPVLTFVFGEAQLHGRCALVSLHRLREEFYGLPPRPELLRERLLKEALHELGHTFGLRHCKDWSCAMASTHAIERLDLKNAAFCPRCRSVILAP